jgi:hypothetical protein
VYTGDYLAIKTAHHVGLNQMFSLHFGVIIYFATETNKCCLCGDLVPPIVQSHIVFSYKDDYWRCLYLVRILARKGVQS